jgi:hypothetical protein
MLTIKSFSINKNKIEDENKRFKQGKVKVMWKKNLMNATYVCENLYQKKEIFFQDFFNSKIYESIDFLIINFKPNDLSSP